MKLFKMLSVGALLLAGAVTHAQNPNGTTPSFGVKGGVNFATVTGDDFDSPDSRTSFHVGALVELPLNEMISIQGEALYSGQGFKTDIPGGLLGGDEKVEYQLDYINVPVLVKAYVFQGLSLEAGPQFSFKVNEEFDSDADADSGDFDVNEAKDFEFGLAAGITFQTQMGLFASGRYNLGLTDIFENSDAKNSVFQIGVGYKF
ncbi:MULTISPECIES: porin family protein [Flavobacterium]|uniref:Porin family protein n=1 Tax=Flavobacterium suzhouense TaxID=1529638 RepID=A0ABW5NWJ8_9FLAO|nr:porin family protein [Flavobacterium sp. AG291]RDI09777.1 outer membrane protein with beta-barrel domain [Flavobacterium sp. AG291]